MTDNDVWHDFPPDGDGYALPDDEPIYVICCSDTVEHLFWSDFTASWGPLANATQFENHAMLEHGEHPHGFWMDYVRAQELTA